MMGNFLHARWENLIMANYAIDPEVLKPYLPAGVELDYYHDKTYVSLVGFLFRNTKIFGIPIPWFGTFEEINLRFYVTRKVGDEIKRGVVFVREIVPYRAVAWLANRFYYERYSQTHTRHSWNFSGQEKHVEYQWKMNQNWYHLRVNATDQPQPLIPDSLEEFIFEHYHGYTNVDDQRTLSYKVNHPSWTIYPIFDHQIQCDFEMMYGSAFKFLNDQSPESVYLAAGSAVTIPWAKERF